MDSDHLSIVAFASAVGRQTEMLSDTERNGGREEIMDLFGGESKEK